jgi:hypothetical protein
LSAFFRGALVVSSRTLRPNKGIPDADVNMLANRCFPINAAAADSAAAFLFGASFLTTAPQQLNLN